MPRTSRRKSSTGIYHVVVSGINGEVIFMDEEDYAKFVCTLTDCKAISGFDLFAYCLMNNHLHLLLREREEGLEKIFKRIGARYVFWHNWKYQRSGPLFQDRFKSEVVETNEYFTIVLRHIHQHPLTTGCCRQIGRYPWSSYRAYLNQPGIVDVEMGLDLIGRNNYKRFMHIPSAERCLDYQEPRKRLTDEELQKEIFKRFGVPANQLGQEPRDQMRAMLKSLLTLEGVSTRQLARVTGISTNIIWRL